jgi:hypothetical protein
MPKGRESTSGKPTINPIKQELDASTEKFYKKYIELEGDKRNTIHSILHLWFSWILFPGKERAREMAPSGSEGPGNVIERSPLWLSDDPGTIPGLVCPDTARIGRMDIPNNSRTGLLLSKQSIRRLVSSILILTFMPKEG